MKYSLRFFAIVLCFSSAGCRRNSSFSDSIGKVVQSGASHLNLGSVTNFAWEDVFVFGPYTPKDAECKTLKLLRQNAYLRASETWTKASLSWCFCMVLR